MPGETGFLAMTAGLGRVDPELGRLIHESFLLEDPEQHAALRNVKDTIAGYRQLSGVLLAVGVDPTRTPAEDWDTALASLYSLIP